MLLQEEQKRREIYVYWKTKGWLFKNILVQKRIVRLNSKNKKTLVVLKILKLLNGSVDLRQLERKLNLMESNSM